MIFDVDVEPQHPLRRVPQPVDRGGAGRQSQIQLPIKAEGQKLRREKPGDHLRLRKNLPVTDLKIVGVGLDAQAGASAEEVHQKTVEFPLSLDGKPPHVHEMFRQKQRDTLLFRDLRRVKNGKKPLHVLSGKLPQLILQRKMHRLPIRKPLRLIFQISDLLHHQAVLPERSHIGCHDGMGPVHLVDQFPGILRL